MSNQAYFGGLLILCTNPFLMMDDMELHAV